VPARRDSRPELDVAAAAPDGEHLQPGVVRHRRDRRGLVLDEARDVHRHLAPFSVLPLSAAPGHFPPLPTFCRNTALRLCVILCALLLL